MPKVTVQIKDEKGKILSSEEVSVPKPDTLVWWIQTSLSDAVATMPKIAEYGHGGNYGEGSADLRVVGESVAELIGKQDISSALKQELGCWFYLQGKVARCIANYQQGQPAKEDTLLDTTVYSMMMRRLQETGQWP